MKEAWHDLTRAKCRMDFLQRQSHNTFFSDSFQKRYATQLLELQEEMLRRYGRMLPFVHSKVDRLWRFCTRVVRPTLVWYCTTQADYHHYHYRFATEHSVVRLREAWVKAELRLAVAQGLQHVSFTYVQPGKRNPDFERVLLANMMYKERWNLLDSKTLSFD